MKASTARKGCRYCLLDIHSIPLPRCELDPAPALRLGEDMERIINQAQHLCETSTLQAAKRLLTEHGYSDEMVCACVCS